MISNEAIEAFNSRLTVNVNTIKTMKAQDQDRVKQHGTAAEVLLKNKDFAYFVHSFKFEVCDALVEIKTHTADDNTLRVALSNQLSGIDSFISSLQRAVYLKNKVVSLEQKPDPAETL